MVSGIWGGYNSIQKVEVDNVGVGHITDKNLPIRRKHTLVPACMWQHETEKDEALSQDPEYIPDERWVGPVTIAFPSNTKWTLQSESHYLGSYTVKKAHTATDPSQNEDTTSSTSMGVEIRHTH